MNVGYHFRFYGGGFLSKNYGMKNEIILHENSWCKVVAVSTYYVVRFKSGGESYFLTSDAAFSFIGIKK